MTRYYSSSCQFCGEMTQSYWVVLAVTAPPPFPPKPPDHHRNPSGLHMCDNSGHSSHRLPGFHDSAFIAVRHTRFLPLRLCLFARSSSASSAALPRGWRHTWEAFTGTFFHSCKDLKKLWVHKNPEWDFCMHPRPLLVLAFSSPPPALPVAPACSFACVIDMFMAA